jgi:hypothetical protein
VKPMRFHTPVCSNRTVVCSPQSTLATRGAYAFASRSNSAGRSVHVHSDGAYGPSGVQVRRDQAEITPVTYTRRELDSRWFIQSKSRFPEELQGKWIAIHDRSVLDSSPDRLALMNRLAAVAHEKAITFGFVGRLAPADGLGSRARG